MSASPSPVRVEAVSKQFVGTRALDNVSLEIERGEVFGLVGPNGAGKTTLIRTILDIIKPDTGRVEVFGHLFGPADRDRIGYLPEERGIYQRQEVLAVLEYLGSLKSMPPAEARQSARRWLERFGLADAATRKIEQLSKGNQQKVQIAATLVARPPVVIFDEPLTGLDPVSARAANTVIREYAAEGNTVILSTHQMAQVEAMCARVFMIARGRRVLYGRLRDIKRDHSTGAIRVVSGAAYDTCPLVARVDPQEDGADVYLRAPATSDEFLAWLVAHNAGVERFEKLDTSLEEIFISAASPEAREAASSEAVI
jgi:ABC-2 type transport system ATP-binding protein